MRRNEAEKGADPGNPNPRGGDFAGHDRKQNGRGAYICKSTECLKKALDRKGLERSLKMGISREIKENLSKEMETLVEE